MKAAILAKGKLTVEEVPKPDPGNEEALVRLISAGVCHSDLHLVKGDWPGWGSPDPMPLGHEGIGIVEALGPGAEKFIKVGDRVILGLGGTGGGYWCGACEFCLTERTRLCRQSKLAIGTHAEYISLWAKALVVLPDEVSDEDVSLSCGGLTSYSAVKKLLKFGVLPGKPIAIVGAAGGLGHYAVQIAKAFGYKVIGVDVGKEKIDFIKQMGADLAVDVAEAKSVVKENFIGVYGSIVFAPKISAFELGLQLMRKAGVFVSVGMPAAGEGSISISPLELIRKDPLIMCSEVGTVEEMRELVQLVADGKVKSHISHRVKLSEINQLLDELEEAKYTGRAIITNMSE